MNKIRIYIRNILTLVLIMAVLPACGLFGQNKLDNPLSWPVNNFSATDQDGNTFGLSDVKGKIWVADFMFTNCTTVCSPMTYHLASLQKKIKEQGYDVAIISLSVDPEHDKPEVLKNFGKKMNVDFSNWHFLTGYSHETIADLAEKSFKSPVMLDSNSDQVTHATSFFLVDQTGTIVKRYNGIDEKTDEQLLKDIKILLKK
jgi:protein SCO1